MFFRIASMCDDMKQNMKFTPNIFLLAPYTIGSVYRVFLAPIVHEKNSQPIFFQKYLHSKCVSIKKIKTDHFAILRIGFFAIEIESVTLITSHDRIDKDILPSKLCQLSDAYNFICFISIRKIN